MSYIVSSRSYLARKKSARAERNFYLARKIFYLRCKTTIFSQFSQEKRGENTVFTGLLLFAIQIYNISRRNPNHINIWIQFRTVKFAAICTSEGQPSIILRGELRKLAFASALGDIADAWTPIDFDIEPKRPCPHPKKSSFQRIKATPACKIQANIWCKRFFPVPLHRYQPRWRNR